MGYNTLVRYGLIVCNINVGSVQFPSMIQKIYFYKKSKMKVYLSKVMHKSWQLKIQLIKPGMKYFRLGRWNKSSTSHDTYFVWIYKTIILRLLADTIVP